MDSSYNIQNYFKRGRTVILTLRQGFDDGGNTQGRQWTDKETTLLMDLMNEFRLEFKGQKRRKKEVWNDVTKRMQDHNYIWTSEDCRKKWSNMMRTFKTIEEQRRHPEHPLKKIKWPFFEEMTKLLTTEGADALPEASSICSFMKEFPVPVVEDHQPGQVDQDGLQEDPLHQINHEHAVDESVLIPDLEITEVVDNTHTNSVAQSHDQSHGHGNNLDHDPSRILSAQDSVPVDTDAMQFYLVDNQDGDIRIEPSGCGVDVDSVAVTAALDASSEDFDTLATVAAAAAASVSGNDMDPGSGQIAGHLSTVPVNVQSMSTSATLSNFDVKSHLRNPVNMNKFSNKCELSLPVSTIPRMVSNQAQIPNLNVNVNPGTQVQVLASQQSQPQISATGTGTGALLLPLPVPTQGHSGKVSQQLPVLSPLLPLKSQSQPSMPAGSTNPAVALPIAPTVVAHRKSALFLKRKAKFHQRKDKDVKTQRMSPKGGSGYRREAQAGCSTSASTLGSLSETGDPIVDKFIAISNKQNEKILERMEKFHEESLNVMRERNKILENMVSFLQQHIGGTAATSPMSMSTSPASSSNATTIAPSLQATNQNPNSSTIITVPAAFPTPTTITGQQILCNSPTKTATIRVINQNTMSMSRAAAAIAVPSASFIPQTQTCVKKS